MKFKVGLHNHSVYTDKGYPEGYYAVGCGRATPSNLIRRAMIHNFDGIAITDTNQDVFFQEVLRRGKKLFGSRYNVEVLKGENVAKISDSETGKQVYFYNGIEMHDNLGHLLVVGYSGSVMGKYENLCLAERIELAKEKRGIVISAHPLMLLGRAGIGEQNLRAYANQLDAMEGFNAQTRTGEESTSKILWDVFFDYKKCNQNAQQLAKELGIPSIAVSDSPRGNINLGYIVLNESPSEQECEDGFSHIDFLKRCIREKLFECYGKYPSASEFLVDYIPDLMLIKLKPFLKPKK